MTPTFRRILIVNRGEPAMRLLHAVRELNQERGCHIQTIALYTDPDRHAMFVREADERIYLGTPTFVDAKDGQRKSSYLDYSRLKRALIQSEADAAWVGWGFVAEHAEFADLCDSLAVTFIGPPGAVMRKLGDKIAAKRLAEAAGVPVAPWSGGPVANLAEARVLAKRVGYPLLVKASAGGGGRGIRKVQAPAQLGDAFASARNEAMKAFGDDTLFLEQMVNNARHVEVQILADHHGTYWAVGVRDCSVQRRNQKVVEEAPSPALDAELEAELKGAAVRLAQAADYRNAGTVECLFDIKTRKFFFMEMNTRLQVEHPVTEVTTGLDLVKLQLQVASGARLDPTPPPTRGHAIEVRLNAEDPDNAFAPAPGRVDLFSLPTGPGLRIDTGVRAGDHVPPDFDSMVAKFIAVGRDRQEALARLRRGLLQAAIVIRGGASNKAFLLELLSHRDLTSGRVDIGWLDRLCANQRHRNRPYADVALIQASIDVHDERLALEQTAFFAGANRGRPVVRAEIGHEVELRYGGQTYQLEVRRLGVDQYRIVAEDGRTIEAMIDRQDAFQCFLTCAKTRYRVLSVVDGLNHFVEVDGMPHRISRDEGGVVRAPAPAVALALMVKPGQLVRQGDPLVVLEAMKMEMGVAAPCDGRVRSVEVLPNQQVDAGAALVVLEPEGAPRDGALGDRVVFRVAPAHHEKESARMQARYLMQEMKRLILGYDIDLAEARQILKRREAICRQLPPDDSELWDSEAEVLRIFADVLELFRKEANGDGISTEEYLHTYLRALDSGGDRLPAHFLDKLRATLAHYGVRDLDRTPALEQALFFIHKAHQRIEHHVDQIFGLLERRGMHSHELRQRATPEFRQILDRLIAETHTRYLPLNDLAREVRYRYFDRPFFERARKQTYQLVAERIAALEHTEADGAERDALFDWLVECPQPLMGEAARGVMEPGSRLHQLTIEMMLRRFYRVRTEDKLTVHPGHIISASCPPSHGHQACHVLGAGCPAEALGTTLEQISELIANQGFEGEFLLDLYLARQGEEEITSPSEEAERAALRAAELNAVLDATPFPRKPARICIAIATPGRSDHIEYFTYRPGAEGFQEDQIVRGIHPMLADRLELWRLENFHTKQLRGSNDIYIFHAEAKDNPQDERLFAFVEVRDATPVYDQSGQLLEIPSLQWLFLETLAGIRDFQARRPSTRRLHWNRIVFYVRPPVEFSIEEIHRVAKKLAQPAKNLGLEKVVARLTIRDPEDGSLKEKVVHASNRIGTGLEIRLDELSDQPIRPLSHYAQKVVRMRRFGLAYPYEIVRMMTPSREENHAAEFPPGEFIEHDLNAENQLVPVDRAPGKNTANLVVGLIRNYTPKVPEGMTRVIILGDASREMGALSEPECRRIIEAINLAQRLDVPLEWFPVSSGAKISMDVGTEGLDWVARVVRRLVEFTQGGGEVNMVVYGVNVGGQSYWNAEATMLMHTRGILVMTPNASMVLTGKRALDYSGGVSAEDNQGIGGVERIMGFNGQAQYSAQNIGEACQLLFRYYAHSYVVPGERFPRKANSSDPVQRNISRAPHRVGDFESIGEVFSLEGNPGRKRPFDIRSVMQATIDADHPPLERWAMMRHAETAVVWDAHLGGNPISLIGIESRPLTRMGFVPGDGPDTWTGGTLFPRSSKKVARAINAASGNRPVVVLANLSGFDGSPESMRELQLEYGAEIGRAVVNFDGPMVFLVISRYHGGAYVVFSCTLNDDLEAAALEGSYASVIGGAPAAAVVFPKDVKERTLADLRVKRARRKLNAAREHDKSRLLAHYESIYKTVYAEKQGEVAEYFDSVHSVQRAKEVGSLHHIVPAAELRPYLSAAVERGIARVLARTQPAPKPRIAALRSQSA